jgi:SdrD B-like domain
MKASGFRTIGWVLLGLLWMPWGAGRAMAQGGPASRSGEDLIRQQAIQKVKSTMGEAKSRAKAGMKRTLVPFARKTATAAATAPAGTSFKCLPSCDVTDGRFLAIAGSGLQTLSPPELVLAISVPAGTASFDLGVFDGDGNEFQSDGVTSDWDSGVTAPFEYTLYADPRGDGSGTTVVELQPGFQSFPSSAMPDNDWIDFTINTGPEAAAPSGNFFYTLAIRLTDPSLVTLNAFKVRSNAVISGLTLNPVARPFSYIASWTGLSDISIVYPNFAQNFPDASVTTYDGTFRFFIDVPVTQSQIFLWDGDFDHGNFDGTDPDTDDPDTPNAPFVPAWSTSEVQPEGVAVGLGASTGDPADDTDPNPDLFGQYIVRPPAVRYDLIFPNGQSFANDNPSGNREWEQFKISTAPFDRSQMDYHTDSIPPGVYQLKISGVDMLNLNALLLPYRVLCVDGQGNPCTMLRPYLVGDTVFADTDGDGNQGPGESGIPGVVLELRDAAGALVSTTTTDANGHYKFEVESGTYTVGVAASNFAAGGALAGLASTTGDSRTDTVNTNNVLTYDFGYRGTGSIGDRVWLDDNANGTQDSGETGIDGVTVQLFDGAGHLLATATTAGDGNYSFAHLAAGTYSVRVVAASLPGRLVETYDLDGLDTPHAATVALDAGAHRSDVDFGYRRADPCVNGPIGGIDLGVLPKYLFLFADGRLDANWQGATKGFAGDVAVDGVLAHERTSGGVPYAGTIFTNDSTLGAWQGIVAQNAGQASASLGNASLISRLKASLSAAFSQINSLPATPGFESVSSASLNGLNTSDGVAKTYVINVTSGFQVSSQIHITGDPGDVFVLRWDTDHNSSNGYQGVVKFQSGGAIVPHGGLTPASFIHVAGDIDASGGGGNPPAPYPQGPRLGDGMGALINGGSNFSGGGFFTGYWLTTGNPSTGSTHSLSNGIFVGGWYTLSNRFSLTSGTSGVAVCPHN